MVDMDHRPSATQTLSESRMPGEDSQNALLTFSKLERSVDELVARDM
jgi:hypothetical protein